MKTLNGTLNDVIKCKLNNGTPNSTPTCVWLNINFNKN